MFNISFERNGEKNCTVVRARIHTDLDVVNTDLLFAFECQSQYASALLEAYLNKKLGEAIERAHRDAYRKGWNDAKSHKKKATQFETSFRPTGSCIAVP